MGAEGHGGLVRVLRGTNQGFNYSCSVQLRMVRGQCSIVFLTGLPVARKLVTLTVRKRIKKSQSTSLSGAL